MFQKGHQRCGPGSTGKHWKLSEKTKKKMSISKKGIPSHRKGKKLSEEHKKKIGLTNKIRHKGKHTGSKSNWWQGGKSFEPYSIDWTETLKKAIREKYRYICQVCNGYGFVVHHIDYDKKNCSLENLTVVCRECHNKTNHNRNYWINYFQFL